jgi:glycosyltransferase involved in cell wall biosynthesis
MPTPSPESPTAPDAGVLVVVAARNEADRIAATLGGLRAAFPGARVWVADDGSSDDTAAIAERAGARVAAVHGRGGRGAPRRDGGVGKGGAVTHAARTALASAATEQTAAGEDRVVLLCDGDLGESARELVPLVEAVRRGEADLAVAAFSTRTTGGLGLTLAFARWAVRRRCSLLTGAPLSGQRAMRARVLRDVLPFAAGYGIEIAMTIDAVRAGHRVVEIPMELSHRPTGRTPAGFTHRGRQLVDCVRVYRAR